MGFAGCDPWVAWRSSLQLSFSSASCHFLSSRSMSSSVFVFFGFFFSLHQRQRVVSNVYFTFNIVLLPSFLDRVYSSLCFFFVSPLVTRTLS